MRVLKLEANVNGMKKVKNQLNFFLISTIKRSVKAFVTKQKVNRKEICDQSKTNDETKIFFKEVFQYYQSKPFKNLTNILNSIDLPCLAIEQKGFCETELREDELCNALKSMPNNKTPGNDGLSKEFYEAFWNELKDPPSKSLYHAKTYKRFSTRQRQDLTKRQKKDRCKILMNNWRPI